ncbi:MAG: YitT family protein [Bacillaceae bacterium]
MKRIVRLIIGLFLYAFGIVLTIHANIGLAPWDVFHQGLSKTLPITMGSASIIIGCVILLLNYYLGEKVGWGTIANVFFIGIFMDILMKSGFIPYGRMLFIQIGMAIVGMLAIGFASWLYIGSELGAGPRDGLMVALTKKTGKSVRFIRSSIEITVLVIGALLGGTFGFGTIFMSLTIGYFIQIAFKIARFDVKKVNHRVIQWDKVF